MDKNIDYMDALKKGGIEIMKRQTKKEACKQVFGFVACQEPRPLSFSTFYQRVFRDCNTNAWRYIGRCYDYTF